MSQKPKSRVVLVSGPPGSGKTTLARPLAERLGFALLTKDDIKESLYTSMQGTAGDVEFSRRIGSAAMEVLWALAPHCPAVVLEANFRTQSSYEREKVAGLVAAGAQIVEVYCRLPREEASRRFAERAREVRHHPAHALAEMPPERMREYEEPFALGPVIEVDTRMLVDEVGLAVRIRAFWE
ncbi:MAG TPA: AAA family ATPase [Acidobacteriaceae bacterium]|nr:AAA family ATPase [Acidobacteriaceae bacterium]